MLHRGRGPHHHDTKGILFHTIDMIAVARQIVCVALKRRPKRPASWRWDCRQLEVSGLPERFLKLDWADVDDHVPLWMLAETSQGKMVRIVITFWSTLQ
jgi:hypothetical protein